MKNAKFGDKVLRLLPRELREVPAFFVRYDGPDHAIVRRKFTARNERVILFYLKPMP
jgi:hypothetical protein